MSTLANCYYIFFAYAQIEKALKEEMVGHDRFYIVYCNSMKKKHLLRSSLVLISCLVTTTVDANIVLNKIIVNFDAGGNSREDVEVWNSSTTETLYVSSTVYKVSNPENEKVEKVEKR